MKESDVTRDLKHYLAEHPPKTTETYEVKIVNLAKQTSFAFNRVAPHQVEGLCTSLQGLWHKISDTSAINGFASKKPFDVIWTVATGAFVVIIFYMPRRFKKAIKIPIHNYIKLYNSWPKKSIHMEDLEKMNFEILIL